uniref:Putative secreted protein n=1 Tax=Ixodes ricinus TaxID=34613 RepID=A0A6B0U745_IXORI
MKTFLQKFFFLWVLFLRHTVLKSRKYVNGPFHVATSVLHPNTTSSERKTTLLCRWSDNVASHHATGIPALVRTNIATGIQTAHYTLRQEFGAPTKR